MGFVIDAINLRFYPVQYVVGWFADLAMMVSMEYALSARKVAEPVLRESSKLEARSEANRYR